MVGRAWVEHGFDDPEQLLNDAWGGRNPFVTYNGFGRSWPAAHGGSNSSASVPALDATMTASLYSQAPVKHGR